MSLALNVTKHLRTTMIVKRDIILPALILISACFLGVEGCFTPFQLPEPRSYTCIIEVENKIYFAGGLRTNAEVSSRIDIFDTTSGTWSVAQLPIARQQIRCHAVGTNIVFSHGLQARGFTYQRADIFDTVSQTVTSALGISAINLEKIHVVGTLVIYRYVQQNFVILDPANGSLTPKTIDFVGAEGWVDNSTHLFAISRFTQLRFHQVDLETWTVHNASTYTMANVSYIPPNIHLEGNQFVLIFPEQTSVFTLGQADPDPVLINTGHHHSSPVVFHDSTIYFAQSASIVVYHPERGTVRYAMPQNFFVAVHSSLARDRILYFSGSQQHIVTIQLDGLLQYAEGGPFSFGNRDFGISTSGSFVSWINLHTQRVQHRPDIRIPLTGSAVELQDYWVFNSGHIFEFSTETWLFIENPLTEQTRTNGGASFDGSIAIFGANLFGLNFVTWHAADKKWRFYSASHLNFANALIVQNKLLLVGNNGLLEVIDMATNASTLLRTQIPSRNAITEDLLILAGGINATSHLPTDQVFIYNVRTNSVTYGKLSMAGGVSLIAQSRTHVCFLTLSTRIDVYSLTDSTWSYIDMPLHFSNDRTQIWLSDLQHVVLQRPQRIDIFDMSTRQWRTLAGPPIDGLTNIRTQGSKILFAMESTSLLYEITTGDWLRIGGDLLSDFRFTDSFFVCQRCITTIYRPLARMTNRISNVVNYERYSVEFDPGLAGSLTTSNIDWLHYGVSLNVSNSRLTLGDLQQPNNGKYTVSVTDQCSQRMEQSAILFVTPRPIFLRPLEDSVNLCHKTVVVETEIYGETSLEWKINDVVQVTTIPTITIQPERLACNVKYQLCVTATNPSGSNQTCAELRLLEHDAVFDGPRPTVDRSIWFLESRATLHAGLLPEDCTRHWWVIDGTIQEPIDSQQSTLGVSISTRSSYTQYAIRAQCGSSVVQSNPFTFGKVSSLEEWQLAAIVSGIGVAIIGAIVTVFLFRRRIRASEVHEMELQSLLTQAKSESLTRDGVSVIPSTSWEWTPTEEFKYLPLDSLPYSIDASNLVHVFKNETVKVDTWNQADIGVTLKSKGGKTDSSLKERLIDGAHIDIYAPRSPKYDVKVEPASFVLKQGKATHVTVSTLMRMTTKCKICLVIVIEQQQLYSILEYKVASAMSTWIDLEEVEMTNDFLGGGGFGTVTRGVYRGEEVAVKRLLNQFMDDSLKQEFEREITLMKDLRHPHIIQFVGASNVKDNLAILIELAPFGSLSSVLQKSKLTVPMKLTILLETAKALQFLHLNRVIHRDIKPQNILVFSLEPKSSVHVKLTDFGTSRFISDTTMTVTKNVGTTLYMAPEALGKNPRIDKSADIYSFGILMWELLFERQPFAEYEWQSDIENHVKTGGRLPLDPASVNPELIKLIEDCWKHDPSARPSASEVVQQLAQQI